MKIGRTGKIDKKKNKMVSGKIKKGKKMIRKLKTQDVSKPIKKPWGGHLPFPPKDCAKKKHIFISDNGIPWIDFGICINCTEYPKGCPRKQNYLREMKLKKEK